MFFYKALDNEHVKKTFYEDDDDDKGKRDLAAKYLEAADCFFYC